MNKSELSAALAALNIDVPDSATIVQLQNLFDRQSKEKVNAIIHTKPSDPTDTIDLAPIDENLIDPTPQDRDAEGTAVVTERNHIAAPADISEQDRLLNDVELEAEINRLEMLNRVMELRAQLAAHNVNNGVRVQPDRRIDFEDVRCVVQKFTGDDSHRVEKWVDDFERTMASFGAAEHIRLLFARRLLGGSAILLLQTVNVNTWPALRAELLREFGRRIDRQDVYNQLVRRRKHGGETVRQYVLAMQALANEADIDEGELVRLIVDGLDDDSTAVAMLYPARTLNQLKDLLVDFDRFCARP